MPDNKRPAYCLYSSVDISLNGQDRVFSLDELRARKTEKELIPKLKSYVMERLDIGCLSVAKKRPYQIEFGDWEISPTEADRINNYYRAMAKKETEDEFFIPVTEMEVYNSLTHEWDFI